MSDGQGEAEGGRVTTSSKSHEAENLPLVGYAALTGTFVVSALLASGVVRAKGRPLPDAIALGDVMLLGTATHKIARLITRDKVLTFLRAPFVDYKGPAGPAEVEEEARSDGPLRMAIGQLVTCPFCMSQWVAAALVSAFALNPRATRMVATVFTTLAVSDSLQHGYVQLKENNS